MIRALPRLALALLVLAGGARAAYVTDQLVAGLFESESLKGKPVRALTSGTPMEIVDRAESVLKVRLVDGAEGWIEKRFVTDERPARGAVLALQAENGKLREQVSALEKQLATGAPEKPASAEVADAAVAEVEVAPVTDGSGSDNAVDLRDAPVWVYGLAAAVMLLIGMVIGAWIVDSANRRRHGGYRL